MFKNKVNNKVNSNVNNKVNNRLNNKLILIILIARGSERGVPGVSPDI
jgi:hypothetical protein